MNMNIVLSDVAGFKETFNSPSSLLNFLTKEYEFWKAKDTELSELSIQAHDYFKSHQIITGLYKSVEQLASQDLSEQELANKISQFKRQQLGNLSTRWLYSSHPFTEAFVNCNKEDGPDASDAFIRIVGMKTFNSISSKPTLMGSVAAYEYLHQKSEITKRSKTERRSLERLRKDLQDANKTLIEETQEAKKNIKHGQMK